MSKRIPQVNELIKRELSQIILRELDFELGVLVTLTRVETSFDLTQSRVYVSVLPETRAEDILQLLGRRIYSLQQLLNRRLNMRPMPKIMFVEEKETAEAGRIEEVLEELKREKE
jgi:ribosome-binding factor A